MKKKRVTRSKAECRKVAYAAMFLVFDTDWLIDMLIDMRKEKERKNEC
jgi:hypothetical protein